MAEHGGYRRPANPAPVSGPGALSRRTDGKQPVMDLPDAQYGEATSFRAAEGAAPMAQTQSVQPPAPPIVGLGEPTQMPHVPVTDGAPMGPGQGIGALGIQDANTQDASYLAKYLPVLLKQADDPNAPPGYKQWVRNVLASLPR